jgi:hypothetical protein
MAQIHGKQLQDSSIDLAAKGLQKIVGPDGKVKSKLAVYDEGALITDRTASLNFVGGGVLASGTGEEKDVTVNIPAETDPVYMAQRAAPEGAATLDSSGKLVGAQKPTETDPVFAASEAAKLVAGDKAKLDSALQVETDGVALAKVGAAEGIAPLDANSQVPLANLPDAVKNSGIEGTVGQPSGLATLGADGILTPTQRPTETDPVFVAQKGVANGVATLGADGKILTAQLPSIAVTDVFVVADETAQLALVAEVGDVAKRVDSGLTYIHNGGTAGTMADWTEVTVAAESDPVYTAEKGVALGAATLGADGKLAEAQRPTDTYTTEKGQPGGSARLNAQGKHEAAEIQFGTTAGTVTEGNDARLSDSRTPTAHQASHISGADQIPVATQSVKGLMAPEDKTKVDQGLADENDPYFAASEAAKLVAGDKAKIDNALTYVAPVAVDQIVVWTAGQFFYKLLEGNVTFRFDGIVSGKRIQVMVENTSTFTVAWPANIVWPDGMGVAPVQTSSKTDFYEFWCNGNYIFGQRVGVGFPNQTPYVPAISLPQPSNLKIWLKADAGIHISGTGVAAWEDQSGNANDLVQANAGSMPSFLQGARNGLPAVHLPEQTATGMSMPLNAGLRAVDSFHLFVAAKNDYQVTGNTKRNYVGASVYDTDYLFYGPNAIVFSAYAANAGQQYAQMAGGARYGTARAAYNSSGWMNKAGSNGLWTIYEVVVSPTQIDIGFDGVLRGAPVARGAPGLVWQSETGLSNTITDQAWRIGMAGYDQYVTGTYELGYFLGLQIGEIIQYCGLNLTGEDRTAVINHLKSRWAIV